MVKSVSAVAPSRHERRNTREQVGMGTVVRSVGAWTVRPVPARGHRSGAGCFVIFNMETW